MGILWTMVASGGNVGASNALSRNSCCKSLMVAKAALAKVSLGRAAIKATLGRKEVSISLLLVDLPKAVVRPHWHLQRQHPKARVATKELKPLDLTDVLLLREEHEDLGSAAMQLAAQASMAADPSSMWQRSAKACMAMRAWHVALTGPGASTISWPMAVSLEWMWGTKWVGFHC